MLTGFRRDRPIRIHLLRIYLEDLRWLLERSSFVISNFTYEFANGGHALKGENFQGSNFPFSRLNHSFLKIKMKRKNFKEHSTAFKAACGELDAEKLSFEDETMNLRRTQEAMPLKLKIAHFGRQTFREFVKHFLECYGKEISLFYCGFTLWYLFH